MVDLKLDLQHTGIDKKNIMEYTEIVENIHKELHDRSNNENDFVGW